MTTETIIADTADAIDAGAALGTGFNAELIRRYDRPGPRYTSYPTALQFTSQFSVLDYTSAIARSNATPQPLSLYVHIPFCASPCFYCGCTKIITRQTAMAEDYLRRLLREAELQSEQVPRSRGVRQLHLGGGTPTYLSMLQLQRLMDALSDQFGLSDSREREFSIEIDPRSIEPAAMKELAAMGFNRVSLGVQDFDPEVQEAVNRVQSPEDTLALIDATRNAGIDAISFDLIYGLPKQTVASFSRTLDRVIDAAPQRISAYSYAHLPERFKPQQRIHAEQLPDAKTKLALLQLTVDKLTGAGYVYIGMDHFARADDPLARALSDGSLQRNFQGYSTHAGLDLIGLGISSIGRVDDCYAQNVRTLAAYYEAIDAGRLAIDKGLRLSAEDRLRRDVIEAIMCRGLVSFDDIEARHGIVFEKHFADALDALIPLAVDGLIELNAERIQVTAAGRYLLRAVALCFDQHTAAAQAQRPAQRPAHSKLI